MGQYYNAGGGCFAGDCIVKLADNSTKYVKEVRKGDKVKSIDGKIH